MTTSLQKSLTEPPKNLKEAIDWVLRVSGRDGFGGDDQEGQKAIKGLAKELIKLLDKDAGEVARGVLKVMGKSITNLADKLGQVTEQVSAWKDHVQRKPFKVLEAYLQTFKGNLENVRDYGSSLGEQELERLKGWLTGEPSGPIAKLAEGLKTLLGCDGSNSFSGEGLIDKSKSYTSAYLGSANWASVPEPDKKTCALIFLGIGPMLFYGLTYLYYWCEGTDGWSKDKLSRDSSTLNKFMKAIGFQSTVLNSSKSKGSEVAEVLNKAFSKELDSAMQSAKSEAQQRARERKCVSSSTSNDDPSYTQFLAAIQKNNSSESYRPENRPLLSSYRIATPFFTPNDTYTVPSTSPATPSFAGYSGLTALAGGAYGLNIGGLGTFVSALLA